MDQVWTIGHSTRAASALLDLLAAHGIARLIDVRKIPRSRRHPWFDADALARALSAAGIGYVHAPGLGGLRRGRRDSLNTGLRNPGFRAYADYMQTPEFAGHLDALVAHARAAATAIMCAEAVPWRCHRSMIADALVARGAEVRHIVSAAAAGPHVLRPEARVADGHVSYPGEPDLFRGTAAAPPA